MPDSESFSDPLFEKKKKKKKKVEAMLRLMVQSAKDCKRNETKAVSGVKELKQSAGT